MAKSDSYLKPPVSEAVIDVRIDPLPNDQLSVLEHIHTAIIDRYPNKKIRHGIEGSVEIQGAQIINAPIVSGPIGYWFESQDRSRVIQARLDGFTFNHLKPDPTEAWPGWQNLEAEAKEAWDVYAKVLNVKEITRFAVRYINTIVIPSSDIDLSDYFTAAPRVPDTLPYQDILYFESAVKIRIPDHNAVAIVRYAPSRTKSLGIPINLDIDVFREERVFLDSFPLWEALRSLRNVKNAIFESNLKQKAREIFE